MKSVPYYVFALAMAVPAALVRIEMPAWLSLRWQILALQYHLDPDLSRKKGQRSSASARCVRNP
jgi:hypothetical protein